MASSIGAGDARTRMPGLFYSSFNTLLGKTVVHAWPKKRPKLSPVTQRQNATFKSAMALVKYSIGESRVAAGEYVKGIPFIAQDVLMASTMGTLFSTVTVNGTIYRSYRLSNSQINDLLDSISSIEGSLLVRGPDGWAAVLPGDANQVLTMPTDAGIPDWADAQGGGGGGGGIDILNPPKASTFPTIINGHAASPAPSVSDGTSAMLWDSGATYAGDAVRCALQAPDDPHNFSVVMGVRITMAMVNYRSCGLFVTDGTKFMAIHQQAAVLQVTKYTNLTTFASNVAAMSAVQGQQWYFKIAGDGTNISFWFSADGVNFVKLYQEALGAYLGTITGIGIGSDANANTTPPASASDHIYGSVFDWTSV